MIPPCNSQALRKQSSTVAMNCPESYYEKDLLCPAISYFFFIHVQVHILIHKVCDRRVYFYRWHSVCADIYKPQRDKAYFIRSFFLKKKVSAYYSSHCVKLRWCRSATLASTVPSSYWFHLNSALWLAFLDLLSFKTSIWTFLLSFSLKSSDVFVGCSNCTADPHTAHSINIECPGLRRPWLFFT